MKRILFAAIIAAIGLLHAYPAVATDIDIPGFDQSSFTDSTGMWLATSDVAQPTGTEAVGTTYLISTLGLGDFSTHSNQIAIFTATGWYFIPPAEGMMAYVQDQQIAFVYSGGAWQQGGFGVGVAFSSFIDSTLLAPTADTGGVEYMFFCGYHACADNGGGLMHRNDSCTPDNIFCFSDSVGHHYRRNEAVPGGSFDAHKGGVYGDGSHDDAAALNAVLTAAAAHSISHVTACGQTLAGSADIPIPAGMFLDLCGEPAGINTTHDYTLASGLQGILILSGGHHVLLAGDGAHVAGGTIERGDGTDPPTTFVPHTLRDGLNVKADMAGTAIIVTGRNDKLDNLSILGFATGIAATAKAMQLQNVTIDATNCLTIDGAKNGSQILGLTCVAALTHNLAEHWPIDNLIGDGAGHWKAVLPVLTSDFQFIDGDTLYVGATVGGGAQSAGGKWTASCGGGNCATVASGTDGCVSAAFCQEPILSGSVCALASGSGCAPIQLVGAVNVQRADGANILQFAAGSTSSVAEGETVTGTCIAANTHVQRVWDSLGMVFLDKAPTCSGSSVTFSFTDDAFVRSMRGVEVSAVQRNGTGITITNSGGVNITAARIYTHDTGIHCGQNCNQSRLVQASFGEDSAIGDEDQVSVLVDGDHNGKDGRDFSITNCVTGQHSNTSIRVVSDSTHAVRMTSCTPGPGFGRRSGIFFEVLSGGLNIANVSASVAGAAFIADGASYYTVDIDNDVPGMGYVAGDVLTATGGTCTTEAQFTVDDVDAFGEIQDGHESRAFVCSVYPSNPIATTGGTGTGAKLETDGFVPSSVNVVNMDTPQAEFYAQSFPGTAFSGVNNNCLVMAVCNSSGSVYVGGVLVGADRGGRMAAATAQSPICGDVVPGSASVKTTVTMPSSPPASCHISVSPGLQNVLVDFNGQIARAPCFGGHDISKLLISFGIEASYIDFVFDGTQWGPSAASRFQYEAMCPGDDQLLTNGQVRFSWNSGSTRFELNQYGGPGGLIVHSQMHVIPSIGLFFGGAGTTSSALNYFYVTEVGADTVTGAANNGSGLIRLTLSSVGGNTGDQVRLLCHSIGGTVEANGPWTGTIIDSTHIDLLSSTFANAFANVGSPLCRVTYISASTTGHHTFNGLETKSDDNNSTLIGMAYVAAAHAVNDSATLRDVASWYNRKTKTCINKYTADRTTTNTTYAEPNAEIECEFVTWGENDLPWSLSGAMKNGTNGDGTAVSAGFDGTTAETEEAAMLNLVATVIPMEAMSVRGSKTGLTEGKHYITLLAKAITGGTSTIYGTTPVTSAEISVPQ